MDGHCHVKTLTEILREVSRVRTKTTTRASVHTANWLKEMVDAQRQALLSKV